MNPLTLEWIKKAEVDRRVARRLMKPSDDPCFDIVCFHSQQSAEKYIKAILHKRGDKIPRIHDLPALTELLSPPIEELRSIIDSVTELSRLSVVTRYPGYFARRESAQFALDTAKRVRAICRDELGLSEPDLFTDRPESSSE